MAGQELIVSTIQKSSIFSYWDLELNVVKEGFYGYGYGSTYGFQVIETGNGTCLFDITTGSGPYSGTISGNITENMNWDIGDDVLVTDLVTFDTFSGSITSYTNSTGSITITVPSSSSSVSVTHVCSVEPLNPPSLDYFNVIGLPGDSNGYGYKNLESPSNITNFEPTYSYGWGYEFANFVFADSTDEIIVKARVLKDESPQSGIRVVFSGSPGLLLNPASVITDANGYASTAVRVNKNIDINQLDGWGNRKEEDGTVSQVFRNLTGAGGRTVTATIYQSPEVDDGKLKISTQSLQRFFTEAVYNLDIGSYAYQEGEDI